MAVEGYGAFSAYDASRLVYHGGLRSDVSARATNWVE